jgi:hypothetical protein
MESCDPETIEIDRESNELACPSEAFTGVGCTAAQLAKRERDRRHWQRKKARNQAAMESLTQLRMQLQAAAAENSFLEGKHIAMGQCLEWMDGAMKVLTSNNMNRSKRFGVNTPLDAVRLLEDRIFRLGERPSDEDLKCVLQLPLEFIMQREEETALRVHECLHEVRNLARPGSTVVSFEFQIELA